MDNLDLKISHYPGERIELKAFLHGNVFIIYRILDVKSHEPAHWIEIYKCSTEWKEVSAFCFLDAADAKRFVLLLIDKCDEIL